MPKCFQKSKLNQVKGDLRCHISPGAPGLAARGFATTLAFETSSVPAITDRACRVFVCSAHNGAIPSGRERRTRR